MADYLANEQTKKRLGQTARDIIEGLELAYMAMKTGDAKANQWELGIIEKAFAEVKQELYYFDKYVVNFSMPAQPEGFSRSSGSSDRVPDPSWKIHGDG